MSDLRQSLLLILPHKMNYSYFLLLFLDIDYLENNCVEEPTKLCEFKKMSGRILKTVDSVYQDVQTIEECRELCLNSPFRCHSYDHGDTGDHVCRLSHHSKSTLADIQVSNSITAIRSYVCIRYGMTFSYTVLQF